MDPTFEAKVYEHFKKEIPETLKKLEYWVLNATISEGKIPFQKEETGFLMLKHDLVIDGRALFTGKEASQIQSIALKFGTRMLRAHEAREIGLWICYGGKYVEEFGFVHPDTPSKSADTPETLDEAAYYWTSSRNPNNDKEMRAMRIYDDGRFDTPYHPISELMRMRMIIVPELLESLPDLMKILKDPNFA